MDSKDSAVKNFLGELEINPFEDNLKDPFVQTEETQQEESTETEEKVEKPLPFNKDPKIQKYIQKEISKALESKESNKTERETSTPERDELKETVDAFTAIIGNDTPEKINALNALQKALTGIDQRATQKAVSKLEEIRQAEIEADNEAEAELDNAFENIEESYGVDITSNNPLAKKTRQDFLTFVERIAPKDRNGEIIDYPDMTSAWETFQDIQKATKQPSRAKQLASQSMARSAETKVEQTQRPSWETVDAFIDSLGK